ncbi:hypothetical protein [uncultured Pseudacidovorax sp.]|uniref:hypothetical protein n=1 Tax=uncultured Pseudacidovorax sp. TaxID=679313 RepID=UPI0025D03B62|nr:hypothetical protein [uncultured Pseudacidovorax sp.]
MAAPTITFPARRLVDKGFRYRSAAETDVKATFARERRRLAAERAAKDAQQQQTLDLATDNVRPLPARATK